MAVIPKLRRAKMMKEAIAVILLMVVMALSANIGFAADNKKDPVLFLYAIIGTIETYVDLDVTPGEQTTFSIELDNSGITRKTNTLFISDGVTADNGGTLVLTPEEAKREKAGAWLNIAEEEVTLDPGEKRVIDFVVNVPEDATLGAHVAVIYLRSAVNPGEESEKSSSGASFIINEAYSLSSAVVIRTGGQAKYDFMIGDNMEQEWIKDKDLALFFNISNIGNIYDYPKANIIMYDSHDEVVYKAVKEVGVVYSDTSCQVDFLIPPQNGDCNRVVFSLDYGKPQKMRVQSEFTMDIPAEEVVADIPKVEIETQSNNTETPNMEVLIMIVSMLLVIVVLTFIIRFVFFRKK